MFWERGTNSFEMNSTQDHAAGVPGVWWEVRPCDLAIMGKQKKPTGTEWGFQQIFPRPEGAAWPTRHMFIICVRVTEFTGRDIRLPHGSSTSSPLDADLPRTQRANEKAVW